MSTPGQNGEPTFFDRALEDYLASLPKDDAKSKFFDLCRNTGDLTAEQFNDLIQDELSKRNLHGPANRLFNRLAGAIMDYSGVIEQFGESHSSTRILRIRRRIVRSVSTHFPLNFSFVYSLGLKIV